MPFFFIVIAFGMGFGNAGTSVGFTLLQVMINTLGTTVIGAFTVGFRAIIFLNISSHAMSAAPDGGTVRRGRTRPTQRLRRNGETEGPQLTAPLSCDTRDC